MTDWPNREQDEQTARELAECVLGTAQEWMRMVDLGESDSARVSWRDERPGMLYLGRDVEPDELGRYVVKVTVTALAPWDPDRPGCAPEAYDVPPHDPCGTIVKTAGARHDEDFPTWEAGTWRDVREGDRIRLAGAEAQVETYTAGTWHAPREHVKVQVRLKGREDLGLMTIAAPNTPLEIECTPERRAQLLLSRQLGAEVIS